jgi:hypothetical protein
MDYLNAFETTDLENSSFICGKFSHHEEQEQEQEWWPPRPI